MGIPVVIAENGLGVPVKAVEADAPVLKVAENGLGAPIVLSDIGAPFVVEGAGPATVPEAFDIGDWSIAPGDTVADVTISSLPADGGATITDVQYRLNGGSWVSSGGTVSFQIAGLTNDVEYGVELRAVNSVGAGAAGDLKTVTPTAGAFSPLDLTQTVAWWTAKSFTTDWTDEVLGQPYTMSGAVYSASAWPGGLDCVTFDGTDDYGTLASPTGWPIGAADGFMMLVVSQDRDASLVSHDTMFGYGESSVVNRTLGRRVTSGVNRAKADTGDGLGNVERQYTSVDFTGPHVVLAEHFGGNVRLSVDGGTAQVSAVTPASNAVRSRIGAGPHNPPPGAPALMKVRDAIVGAGQLSTQERTDLIAWAMARAGL